MSYNVTGALQGGNLTLANPAIGGLSGAATTFTTTNAISYSVAGKLFGKAAIGAAAVPVNDASTILAVAATAATGSAFRPLVAQQTPAGFSANIIYAGSVACFVFGLDALGNVRVAQGRVVQYSDTSANSTTVPLPTLPDWMTPFAYAVIKLVSATATSWTFGTGLWNATGITIDAPVNIMAVPPTDPITV